MLAALTIVSVALVGWGLERLVALARDGRFGELEIRIGVSQVLILIAFMFSFVLAMTAAFVGAPAIGGDLETGVALRDPRPAVASAERPRRPLARLGARRRRVHGRVRAAWRSPSSWFVSGYGPPEPGLAVAFLAAQALVLLTLTLALGSVLPVDRGGRRRGRRVRPRLDGRRPGRRRDGAGGDARSAPSPRRVAGCSRPTACGAA